MQELAFVLSLTASLTVGSVLVLAGLRKARNRSAFVATLGGYRVLPQVTRAPLGYGVPALEVALGVALLSYALAPVAGLAAALLLAAFTLATVLSFGIKGQADCGCFGGAGAAISVSRMFTRNAALACLALLPAALASAGPTAVSVGAALVVLVASMGVLIAALMGEAFRSRPLPAGPALDDPARRRVLKAGVAAVAGVATASFIPLLQETPTAEAACSGCGTCSKEYYWIGCAGNCCAYYWVRNRDWCSPSCYPCGSWSVQMFCGIPGCGC